MVFWFVLEDTFDVVWVDWGTCTNMFALFAFSPTEEENVARASAAAACGPPETFPRKSMVLYSSFGLPA